MMNDKDKKYEQLLTANAKLREHLEEIQAAHRKSQVSSKLDRASKKEINYVNQLVNDYQTLLKKYRHLERKFIHYVPQQREHQKQGKKKFVPKTSPSAKKKTSVKQAITQTYLVDDDSVRYSQEQLLLTIAALNAQFKELEIDITRLRKENEILLEENKTLRLQRAEKGSKALDFKSNSFEALDPENIELHSMVRDQSRKMKLLDEQYSHLAHKLEVKSKIYEETRQKNEKLHHDLIEAANLSSKQQAQIDDLSNSVRDLGTLKNQIAVLSLENSHLESEIANLSSRPFSSISRDLLEKNSLIAGLQEYIKELENNIYKLNQEKDLALKHNATYVEKHKEALIEQQKMKTQVLTANSMAEQHNLKRQQAELVLRLYLNPSDEQYATAVKKAVKMMYNNLQNDSGGIES